MNAGLKSAGLQGAVGATNQLGTASTTLKVGSDNLETRIKPLKAGSDNLAAGYTKLEPSLIKLKAGSKGVSDGVNELVSSVNNAQTTLKNASDTKLAAYIQANPKAMDDQNMKAYLATLTAVQAAEQSPANVAKITALTTAIPN